MPKAKANQSRIGTQYKTVGRLVDLLRSALFGDEEGKFSPEAIQEALTKVFDPAGKGKGKGKCKAESSTPGSSGAVGAM
eukprot:5720039-Pleurochrysis_carterae.AAC.1